MLDRARIVAERNRAENALAALQKTARPLLQFAKSEAALQHFDSALQAVDAAIGLDPTISDAHRLRAWILVGEEHYAEAADTLRALPPELPDGVGVSAAIALLDELSHLKEAERWNASRSVRLLNLLEKVGATGQSIALSKKLVLGGADRAKMVNRRLGEWLGSEAPKAYVNNTGLVTVDLSGRRIDSLAPLRGLPIGTLIAQALPCTTIDPLEGIPLTYLNLFRTPILSLDALRGMPLQTLIITQTEVRSLEPLRGMPLEELQCMGRSIVDFSPLSGAPLKKVNMGLNQATTLAFLEKAPVEDLQANANVITNVEPLRGKPIRNLDLQWNQVSDFSPLRGNPIRSLAIANNPVNDLRFLLELPKLEELLINDLGSKLEILRSHPTLKSVCIGQASNGYTPVADFWRKYDAKKPVEIK